MASLSQLEKQIAKYDAEAPNIQENLKKKINEQFEYGKPWLENIATWERNILPTFYEQFANLGTGAADLSPAQKMALASKNVSRSGALADVARGIYGKQQQREGEMLRDMLNAWQLARQTAVDAWSRQFNLEQSRRGSTSPTNPWDSWDFTLEDDDTKPATGAIPQNTGGRLEGMISGGKKKSTQPVNPWSGAKSIVKQILPDSAENIVRNVLNLFRK